MDEQMLAYIASANLSQVTCPFCRGRLYTGHKPDCSLDASDRLRVNEIAAEALRLWQETEHAN